MKKVYFDTNVFLSENVENVLAKFEEPIEAIIKHVVLKEMDTFKNGFEIKNDNARHFHRFLNQLRSKGKLSNGIEYNNHIIRVEIVESELDLSKPDNQIILAAFENKGTLFSQDLNELIIADALGIDSYNFEMESIDANNLYKGYEELYDLQLSEKEVLEWFNVPHNESYFISYQDEKLVNNQFVVIHTNGYELEGIYKKDEERIYKIKEKQRAFELEARTREQKFLIHSLLDPEIHFVSALGGAGCGKTVAAFAAGLEQTIKKGTYNKIVAMRPLIALGEDIGYLPGDKFEKLENWMASSFDALEFLLDSYEMKDEDLMEEQGNKAKIKTLVLEGFLEFEAITYIRGRSIPNQFIIVDDAQNLTIKEAVSILTRAGEGTKIVFLGDLSPKQIDNHRISPNTSGLAYVIQKLKGEKIVGHVTLETVIRSELAKLGVKKL